MKRRLLYFLFAALLLPLIARSQVVPSDCTPPALLRSEYEWDVKNLTLRRMFELNSPDTALVRIPAAWQDTIMEGLAAVFNAVSIPERDSVFNLYCVHDNVASTYFITKEIMLFVDTNYAWTGPWQNLVTLTGNPQVDTIMARYQMEVTAFYNWSFGSMALLATDSLWNIYALIDTLEAVPGVLWGEPNQLIGAAGIISYQKTPGGRYYDFVFQWNDCFDGCDNLHAWQYAVNDDCSVQYLGAYNWGAFQILPLPAPINCNLFTGIGDPPVPGKPCTFYPNPVSDKLTVNTESRQEAQLLVLDFCGRTVLSAGFSGTVQIDVAGLAPGIYFLCLVQEGRTLQAGKFIREGTGFPGSLR